MSKSVRNRFWIETGVAVLTTGLTLLTLLWRNWIEAAFGIDPDLNSGTLEWTVVGVLFVLSLALVALAQAEWRRPRAPAN
jgi:hypothetical protein